MISVDTNVVVRFLTADDPTQSPLAAEIFGRATAEAPIFVSSLVLAETWWVLMRSYGIGRADLVATLSELVESDGIVVESPATTQVALSRTQAGADFPDALIAALAEAAGADETWTFDRRAARSSGMRLVGA